MEINQNNNYFDIIQIFRGIAALMVVCHHTIGSIFYYHKIQIPFFYYIAVSGKYGVDFFFVLSGFIISYTAFYKYNRPNSFSNYIKNRLLRIYVPYLPIGIAMLLLYYYLPFFSNSNRNISTLTTLTLFPYGKPALSVAWTLSYELIFYFLFSISFFSKKSWNCFIVLWFSLLIIFNFTTLKALFFLKTPFFQILFSAYNFEFLMGYLLSLLVIYNKKIPLKFVLYLIFISFVSYLFLLHTNSSFFYFSTNLSFAIMVFFLLYFYIVYKKLSFHKSNLFMLIGNATFSIYLIHNPLQMIFIRFYPKINSGISLIIALLLSIVLSVIFGYLYYWIFEKIALQKVKSIVTIT